MTTGDPSGGEKKAYRHDRIRGLLRPVFCQKNARGQNFFLSGDQIRLRASGLSKSRPAWGGPMKNRWVSGDPMKIRLLSGEKKKSHLLFEDRD